MSWSKFSVTASGPDAFRIDDGVLRALRENLPSVASQTIAAVTSEVPGYGEGLSGPLGENIEAAVQMAIGGFLKLVSGSRDGDPSTPRRSTLEGATPSVEARPERVARWMRCWPRIASALG